MSQAHIRSILPQRGGVSPVNSDTTALFHFGEHPNDVIRGIKPIGYEKGLYFNGTSTAITFKGIENDFLDIKNKITMEAWFKASSFSATEYNYIISKNNNSGSDDHQFGVAIEYGKNLFITLKASVLNIPYALKTNQWYHFASTWDGTTHKVYMNGILVGTQAVSGQLPFKPNFSIGRRSSSNSGETGIFYFNGVISDVKLWSATLSQEEVVQSMYSNYATSSLAGYWKMNEAEGNIIYDYSNGGNDIVALNSSWVEGRAVYTLDKKNTRNEGIMVEEGTTNLFSNSLFNGFASWSRGGGGAGDPSRTWEMSYPVATYSSGNAIRMEVTSMGTNNDTYIAQNAYNVEAGKDYTFSAYVKSNVLNTRLTVRFLDASNQMLGDHHSAGTTEVDEYQRLILTAKAPANATRMTGYIRNWGSRVGEWAQIEAPQVEEKSYVTSFVDKSRSRFLLQYPNPITGASEFTISLWFKPLQEGTPNGHVLTIANLQDINRNNLNIDYAEKLRAYYYDSGGTARIAESTLSINYNQWIHIAVTKDNAQLKLYVDGVLRATTAATNPLALGNVLSLGERVGSGEYNGRYTNAVFDELRIDKIARTAEEIQAWYTQGRNGW